MNLPSGVATTSCDFYNKLDQTAEQTALMNEIYKRWLKGWVGSSSHSNQQLKAP
jgi:hypothetical protein